MKKLAVAAATLVATLAQPVGAVTFPTLTTIYVGTGVKDDNASTNTGVATAFHCSNVSGVTATVRFLVLTGNGSIATSSPITVLSGSTVAVSTHFTLLYNEDLNLGTGIVNEGVVNIESTQSGVFCNAKTIDASTAVPNGITLPLVRVNPHPGTVE